MYIGHPYLVVLDSLLLQLVLPLLEDHVVQVNLKELRCSSHHSHYVLYFSSLSNLSTLLSVQPLNSPLSPTSQLSSQSNLSTLLSVQPLNSPFSPTSQLSSQSNLTLLYNYSVALTSWSRFSSRTCWSLRSLLSGRTRWSCCSLRSNRSISSVTSRYPSECELQFSDIVGLKCSLCLSQL